MSNLFQKHQDFKSGVPETTWSWADTQKMVEMKRDNTWNPVANKNNNDPLTGGISNINSQAQAQGLGVTNYMTTQPNIAQARSGNVAQPAQVTGNTYGTQLMSSYQGLTPTQKNRIGNIDAFSQSVQSEIGKGLNEDVAIGNVIMNADKVVPPQAVTGTTGAKSFVENIKLGIDNETLYKQQYVPNQPQPTNIQSTNPQEQGVIAEIDNEYNQIFNTLEQRYSDFDKRGQEQISQIQSKYDIMRAQMQQFNANRLKGLEIMGGRAGRQRFAQEIQSGLLSAEQSAGFERLNQINLAEQQATLEIARAIEDKNYELMMTQLELKKQARQEKSIELDKIYERAKYEEQQRKDIYNLALSNPVEFAEAGVSFNDSIDIAMQKITPFLAKTVLQEKMDKILESQKLLESQQKTDEILSVTEAKTLGVPYGTTRSQAIAMGINPAEKDIVEEEELIFDYLTEVEQLQASILANEIFGKVEGNKDSNREVIAKLIASGQSMQDIKNIIKESGLTSMDGVLADEKDEVLSTTDAERLGVPYGTTKGQAIQMGINPQDVWTRGEKFKAEIEISDKFLSQVKDPQSALNQLAIIDTAGRLLNDDLSNGKLNPVSQAILVTFQKILDPTSVVRESEYARSGAGQSLLNNLEGYLNKLQEGGAGVTKENLQGFVEVANELSKNYKQSILSAANLAKTRAENNGLDITNILDENILNLVNELEKPPELPVLNRSYATLDDLIMEYPEYLDVIYSIEQQFIDITGEYPSDDDILQILEQPYIKAPVKQENIPTKQQSFTNDPSKSVKGLELGELSEKFESGGDPGAIGYDKTGGYSYGTYQLAHNNAEKFIKESTYMDLFENKKFNSEDWQKTWKELAQAEPDKFKKEQKEYIKKTHYDPQIKKLSENGVNIDNLSPAMQQVIWSTAVQHGGNTDVIIKALKKVGKGASERDIITAIYDERSTRFGSSTEQIRKSVLNRFSKEKELALNMLA
jgi:hypothetical protein